MQILNGKIAVTMAELTRSDDGDAVMSRANYDALNKRERFTVLRRGGGRDTTALVDYDSLPERFRKKYADKYGDPHAALRREESKLKMNDEARRFYEQYRLEDGSALKDGHIEEYTINASVLMRLVEMENRQKACRHMSGNSTPVAWEGIYAQYDRWREECGHTLPKSREALRQKMRDFRREGLACLVSGKLSNGNSTKLTPEAGRYIIALKRSMAPVYTNQQIFDKFNEEAGRRGFKPLRSINTLVQFLDRPEVMARWKDTERGELAAKAIFTRKFSTELPSVRDMLWYEDGTKMNLYYKEYVPGEGNKPRSLYVCEVVDAFSEVFLGCHICRSESLETIYEAVRDAVETARFLPCEFVTDNQGGTKRADAKAFFAKIARVAHTTQPDNASSKTIESIFGRFQSQVLHRMFGFTGQNITAKSSKSRANVEFILANVENLPTREEAIAEYMECRRQWNAMPHPKYGIPRMELYQSTVNPEAVPLTESLLRQVFWLRSREAVVYTNSGITITVNGQKHTYEVFGEDGRPDVRFLTRNAGRKFVVEYDPHAMDTVRLNIEDKNYGLQFVTEAKPYWCNHRAIFDQEEGERAELCAVLAANQKERVRRDLENRALELEFGVAPEQHGLVSPRLKGISQKDYERYADEIRAEQDGRPLRMPGDTLPGSVGRLEKEVSNFDPIDIYNRM